MNWGSLLLPLLPVVVGMFSPLITEVVKKGVGKVAGKIPNPLIPVINAVVGAVLAALGGSVSGAPPEVTLLAPALGVAGAQVGKSVRDQLVK